METCVFHLSAFADEASPVFAEQLAALKENNVGMIEVRGVNGKNVMDLTDEEAFEAKKLLDEYGIKVSALGSPIGKIGINDDFAEHMAKLERAFALCDIFKTSKIRMFSFFIPEKDTPAQYRDKVFERMGKMLDAAEKHGITLYHENEKAIYGDTDDRCLDLMEAFFPRLRCVFDPANFVQCRVDPKEAFPRMAKYVGYMHVKDALFADGAVVPCGKGDGSLRFVLDSFSELAEESILTIEPHLKVFDGLQGLQNEELKGHYSYPDSKAAFKAACDALKETLAKLGFTEDKGGKGIWTK